MFVKISSVAALPDYVLLVGFTSGEYKQFDLKPLIEKYEPFKSLTQVTGLYEQVKIDAGGYGLIWNDDLDISADGIYEKGTVCEPPSDIDAYRQRLIEEFVKARKTAGLSQKQLEILSGIPQPCIARTEKGITDPQLTTLLKMLKPLGLTLSITNI
ncbi:MAG: DUF2442 domain-containing protein [Firmicutes bacterium]|nr:DUF2442 domain-containing protein [Bacillota bacterium]